MSRGHGTERPSHSSRRITFVDAQKSDLHMQHPAALSLTFPPPNVSPCSMPNFERLQYSNKESVKVNMGLTYGTRHDHNGVSTASAGFHMNKPAVDVDFGRLTAPMVASARQLGTAALVHKLLHPPPHAFVYGVLSMQWVIGVIGRQHIKFRNNDERYVLAFDSQLRTRGTAFGIPVLYMEWLCGDDEEMSSAEQGLHLTPEYFEQVSSDMI